ncbi:MAG: hypothetical protein ACRBBN_08115 [Methyloligellaceae bacterium]
MSGPRYSIIPGRFVDDDRAKLVHYRLLNYFGRKTDKEGWCFQRLKHHQRIADKYSVARETIVRGIRDLIKWGYLDQKKEYKGREVYWFYRVKMDQDIAPQELLNDVKDGGSDAGGCDLEITKRSEDHRNCDLEITERSGDHHNCDLEITAIYKDKRPPLTTPTLKKKERGCERFPILEMSRKKVSEKVIRNFLKPLTASLQLDAQQDLDFFERLCRRLEVFSEKALTAACDKLEVSRTKFPSIKICVEECARVQSQHMLILNHQRDAEAWNAWKSYYANTQGLGWRASRMENLEDQQISVNTKFPPVVGEAAR